MALRYHHFFLVKIFTLYYLEFTDHHRYFSFLKSHLILWMSTIFSCEISCLSSLYCRSNRLRVSSIFSLKRNWNWRESIQELLKHFWNKLLLWFKFYWNCINSLFTFCFALCFWLWRVVTSFFCNIFVYNSFEFWHIIQMPWFFFSIFFLSIRNFKIEKVT